MNPRKKNGGDATLPPRNKKDKIGNLHIRLPDSELRAFNSAAEKSGFNFTTWVRLNLRRAAGMERR